MDNTNSKLSLIIVASSACAAVIASAYLLYQLNQKDDQIVKLKKEIQRLSHQINKNSMNNNEIINHNTHYNRKSQHLKNRLNNGINHVCNDQNHLNNGLIANNFNKSKKNVRFLSMEERQNNHDATDAKPIHYDNGMYAFSKSSSENLLLYTNNELNKFESNSILSDAGGEDEFFDTIESLSNLESSCQVILNDIKNLESKGDINYILVYNLLSQCEFKEPEFYCAKAKFSRYMARIEEENENEEQSKHYFFEAHKFSKIAETLDPDNTEVKKWCAITLGDLSEYVSLSDRVKNALIVKHYAESCLMEDQNDPLVHYLLGRWHFKVASLSWLELRAARAFSPEFPSTTIEKALQYFVEAERLKPDFFISNLLYIAKCHLAHRNPDKNEAFFWLQKAYKITTLNADDRRALTEVRDILHNQYDLKEYMLS